MTYSWRKLRSEIISTCENYQNVIIMTSGGVDSMFLANFVVNAGLKPVILHFQHGIREDDYQEAKLVRTFAEKHGLRFELGHGNGLTEVKNQEALARDQRWTFVESIIARNEGKTIVLTAHHYDDQIEHFFMSAMRGRKVKALSMKRFCRTVSTGQNPVEYMKYKPLLELEKEEIYDMARKRRIEWIEDPTNQDDCHERNVFRNNIIPQMMKIRNVRTSMRSLFEELSSD